jgi:hypothetical protein
MFLETLGGDFRNFLRQVLATLSIASGHQVLAGTNDALEKDMIRSLLVVVVISLPLKSKICH